MVQHEAPESASDKWASGANGYLKRISLLRNSRPQALNFWLRVISTRSKRRPWKKIKFGDFHLLRIKRDACDWRIQSDDSQVQKPTS